MLRIVAWAGGVVFVAALLYTVYFYSWPLGEPLPDNARPLSWALPANVILFGLFAAHHSLFARDRVKRLITRAIPVAMERSLYVWVASGLLVAVLGAWQFVEGLVYWVEGPVRWAFHVVQLAGIHLTLRGAAAIDPLELAGIRPAPPPDRMLFRSTGVFGFVRHPIYLGWILVTLFAPKLTINRLIFALISGAYSSSRFRGKSDRCSMRLAIDIGVPGTRALAPGPGRLVTRHLAPDPHHANTLNISNSPNLQISKFRCR